MLVLPPLRTSAPYRNSRWRCSSRHRPESMWFWRQRPCLLPRPTERAAVAAVPVVRWLLVACRLAHMAAQRYFVRRPSREPRRRRLVLQLRQWGLQGLRKQPARARKPCTLLRHHGLAKLAEPTSCQHLDQIAMDSSSRSLFQGRRTTGAHRSQDSAADRQLRCIHRSSRKGQLRDRWDHTNGRSRVSSRASRASSRCLAQAMRRQLPPGPAACRQA